MNIQYSRPCCDCGQYKNVSKKDFNDSNYKCDKCVLKKPFLKICGNCERRFDYNEAEFGSAGYLLCNDCYRRGEKPKHWPAHWKWENYYTLMIEGKIEIPSISKKDIKQKLQEVPDEVSSGDVLEVIGDSGKTLGYRVINLTTNWVVFKGPDGGYFTLGRIRK